MAIFSVVFILARLCRLQRVSDMNVSGKKIVLTGAVGGIGRAFANMLDRQGARLVLVGRDAAELDKLNQELHNRHQVLSADLTTQFGRDSVYTCCKQQGIDVLINNAGIGEFALLDSQDPGHIARLIDINLVAPILLTQLLLPLLKEAPAGTIINIGSTFGSIGYPGFSSYSASKFGLRGFTEALRRELANTPMRVLYLAPRATRTAMNSSAVNTLNDTLGNAMDDPEVVAAALQKLIGSNQATRYLGWPEKLFVRINSLLPALVDKALRKQLPVIQALSHASCHPAQPE